MMLLRTFADPGLNLTLELFVRMAASVLQERLVSVVLYGSVAFDDLAPGYGDLDFLAVVDGSLSDEICQELVEMRRPLRSGDYGTLCQMLEGAFLPRPMLNPDVAGRAFWWGTSGERSWERNQLGWLVLHVLRERGVVIWGQDIRQDIPAAGRDRIVEELRRACQTVWEKARGGDLHSVDWLLDAARQLLWLREGRLSSKSEAADWGYRRARGAWRELLPRAKELRLDPALADRAESQQWLAALTPAIGEARDELERELAAQHSPVKRD